MSIATSSQETASNSTPLFMLTALHIPFSEILKTFQHSTFQEDAPTTLLEFSTGCSTTKKKEQSHVLDQLEMIWREKNTSPYYQRKTSSQSSRPSKETQPESALWFAMIETDVI
eukprot:TRINITY_DN18330_c0_g1_i1.p2 TRINITY_DN18330_c0_g1~~TRINITY_DN18330_c0_g1_i1.p2  ORF type:complete len:114 (+),score=12.99 TRINITY_DN18330_c0_g1_i1:64-405(+)